MRMLFIDYSSAFYTVAFNTIVPTKLIIKLRILGLNTSLCNWILDFLTGCPQVVRLGILNMWDPQGCMLSPLLYSLFTYDYRSNHDSSTIIKFADDITVVGLITDNDETAYKEEVRDLAVWCKDNDLSLNVSKTKELIMDYRKRRAEQTTINIDR